MKYLKFTVLALATMQSSAAFADEGLYEDVFAPNSSFVRVVAPGQTVVSIDGTTVRDLQSGVSRYINVMPGDIEVVLPGGNTEIPVAASTHYTLIMGADGTTSVVVDDITNSPAKADVSLYNLTEVADVDLFVPAANAVAIDDIAALQAQTIAVRAPLTLDLEVRVGDEILTSVSQVDFKRGAGVSIVFVATNGGFSAVAVPNSYQN